MSYVSAFYHVVFSTYKRQPSLNLEHSGQLYAVIGSIINKRLCKALIINGVCDHLHILLSLHPQVALSSLMRDIKSQSSVWVKESGLFPDFDGWEKEYGAFSISASHKEPVYEYIQNQRIHHKTIPTEFEFERLVKKSELQIYYKGSH